MDIHTLVQHISRLSGSVRSAIGCYCPVDLVSAIAATLAPIYRGVLGDASGILSTVALQNCRRSPSKIFGIAFRKRELKNTADN
eukprot:2078676-Pleurochrysis_carterae.AAC.5